MATNARPRPRTGLTFSEKPDALDRMLADEGDTSADGWRDVIAEQIPPIIDQPSDLHSHMRIGRRTAALATECAARHNLSREGWMRKLMAEAIEREMGVPASELINEVKPLRARSIPERLQRDDR